MNATERFDRQVRFFGAEGQAKLAAANVAVVGVGGLGTHVVQQLALLGVGRISVIDSEELSATNRNRYVTARHDDPIPGTRKVDIAERLIQSVDPQIAIQKVHNSFVSQEGFETLIKSDYVFGCLDSEGARLVLTELSAAYAKPYFDLASDVVPGNQTQFGGQVCVAWEGSGCLVCFRLLDLVEARIELAGEDGRRLHEKIYGVPRQALQRSGPSVVSMNGVVASLAVTEFMLVATGQRTTPKRILTYRGHMGRVAGPVDQDAQPDPDCYYCKGIWGQGVRADVQRYIRAGIGEFLR